MKPNKTLRERMERLLPADVPRYIRAYDNGGVSAPRGSVDRYTVLFTGRAAESQWKNGGRFYQALAMNAAPFHPQGFGQHTEATAGTHLGKRITFAALPEDCRKLVLSDYCEIWGLPLPMSQLSDLVRGYLVAALWTEDEDAGSGDFEANGRPDTLWHLWAPESIAKAREDCQKFAGTLSKEGVSMRQLWQNVAMTDENAGHNLWLTRNRHGTGFWDREGDKNVLERLTDAAHSLGETNLYPGDDGKLYFSR